MYICLRIRPDRSRALWLDGLKLDTCQGEEKIKETPSCNMHGWYTNGEWVRRMNGKWMWRMNNEWVRNMKDEWVRRMNDECVRNMIDEWVRRSDAWTMNVSTTHEW